MRQSRKPLTPQQEAGRIAFDAIRNGPSGPNDWPILALEAASAYLDTLAVLPAGGRKAKAAIKAEIRRRKL